jgi:hypothetical protein
MKTLHAFFAISLSLAGYVTSTNGGDESYRIETIPFPDQVPPEVGAIGFTPSGKIVVALRRSDVIIATPAEDPADFEWRLFGSGLHESCGMHIVSDHEILISQMPELTRLVDTDEDGAADLYESVSYVWGMSGNYHETNHLTPDGKGGYFVAVGTASHNGPVFYNIRGDYSKTGRRGRNFSAANWRGWVLHIDSAGVMTPWASGFRMHNGILLDSKGDLWAGDNQGDWKATTPFYHIERDHFYGHPSSLVWDPSTDPDTDPLELPLEKLAELKTPAAILLPHNEMNRSASEPIEIPPGDTFGPYGGQILLPDNNGRRITRLMLEKVDGVYQGACAQFYEENGLNLGNNRVVFSPDKKTLYVGHTSRGWGQPAEGLQRLTYTGKVPFDVKTMSLTKHGFRLDFTADLPEGEIAADHFSFRRYRYEDTALYGGEPLAISNVPMNEIRKTGSRTIDLTLDKVEGGGWVYEMSMSNLLSASGTGLRTGLFCYTVNRVRTK